MNCFFFFNKTMILVRNFFFDKDKQEMSIKKIYFRLHLFFFINKTMILVRKKNILIKINKRYINKKIYFRSSQDFICFPFQFCLEERFGWWNCNRKMNITFQKLLFSYADTSNVTNLKQIFLADQCSQQIKMSLFLVSSII